MRHAAYGKFNGVSRVVGCGVVFFLAAAIGHDPQRGSVRRAPRPA